MQFKKDNRGITLVELIIVLALISVVLFLTITILLISKKSFDLGMDSTIIQQDARRASDHITDKLKFAKYVSSSPLTGQEYYRISLEDNALAVSNIIVEKYDSSGVVTQKMTVSKNIKSLQFTSGDENSKLIDFEIMASSGDYNYQLKSSVTLNNSSITEQLHGSTILYFSLYE